MRYSNSNLKWYLNWSGDVAAVQAISLSLRPNGTIMCRWWCAPNVGIYRRMRKDTRSIWRSLDTSTIIEISLTKVKLFKHFPTKDHIIEFLILCWLRFYFHLLKRKCDIYWISTNQWFFSYRYIHTTTHNTHHLTVKL